MKNFIKLTLGSFFIKVLPNRANRIANTSMTIDSNNNWVDRLIRNTLLIKAEKEEDFEKISEYHKNYWSNKGNAYFESNFNQNILNNFFIPNCSFLIDFIKNKLETSKEKYHTLIEIGTGDGSVLDYLQSELIELKECIGIDLSIQQIEKNRLAYSANAKLKFVAADGFEWIENNTNSNLIIITSRGVLEYFTKNRILQFLESLRQKKGSIIFIAIEPTNKNHDLLKNKDSIIHGSERSFSHNYLHLFKEKKYEIWHHSVIDYSEHLNFNIIVAHG
ncbi:MAG: class I SAM-dependent methyltransferase [Jejuia sp.]